MLPCATTIAVELLSDDGIHVIKVGKHRASNHKQVLETTRNYSAWSRDSRLLLEPAWVPKRQCQLDPGRACLFRFMVALDLSLDLSVYLSMRVASAPR